MDVIAAVSLDGNWTEEMLRAGLNWKRVVADFDRDVRAIVFYAAPTRQRDGQRKWNLSMTALSSHHSHWN